jgi:hypothetical protein
MKLTSEQLSDIVIESMALSVALLERFEIMSENKLFVQKAKQSLNSVIPHIEAYVAKLIKAEAEEEVEYFKKAGTVIAELSGRIEKAVTTKNIMDVSLRKELLKESILTSELSKSQSDALYKDILETGVLNY